MNKYQWVLDTFLQVMGLAFLMLLGLLTLFYFIAPKEEPKCECPEVLYERRSYETYK